MRGTVLIVDDEPAIRRAFGRGLRMRGWTVLEAAGPVQAADLYASADVVLSDWDMPEGGGARVLAEAGRPCVVCSAGDPPVPHLSKPAELAAIDAALVAARAGA